MVSLVHQMIHKTEGTIMDTIYRVAHGFDFDVDGFAISKYRFFDNLDDAMNYCNSVAAETREVLSVVETDRQFKEFYYKRIGKL